MPGIRIAVVGCGQFGRNHVRVAGACPRADLVAVVDRDLARAQSVGPPGCLVLADWRELIGRVDAAVVAVPTQAHAEVGCGLMEAGIDVLVEKPMAPDLADADCLLRCAERFGRILQVGHLERFNPAVAALEKAITLPLFFEIHRMSVFSPRSLDIDVVLDLMIHDINVLLSLVRSELTEIRAAGISVLSHNVDIANVRLQFQDGCVANLTASRVSTEKVRKLRIFQPKQYISIDYARQDGSVVTVGADRQISFQPLPVTKAEPLALQLDAFLDAVETRQAPKLNGLEARHTLQVALAILGKIREHTELVAATLADGWKP